MRLVPRTAHGTIERVRDHDNGSSSVTQPGTHLLIEVLPEQPTEPKEAPAPRERFVKEPPQRWQRRRREGR